MTPRAFLVRGLLVGLLAGLAAFVVAFTVGEPHVERAIELEESAAATTTDHHADDETVAPHTHGDEESGTEVSRSTQKTWGLLTGTVAVGLTLGGIVALAAAGAVGRLGRLTVAQSTGVVALVGYVAYSLVPFVKYPATPPAVGNPDTIGDRTAEYFGFVALSLAAAVLAVVVANRVWRQYGALPTVVATAVGYLAVVLLAGNLLPSVDEVGSFPADTLWEFRVGSLATITTLWLVLGVGLAWAAGRLSTAQAETTARRELAASL